MPVSAIGVVPRALVQVGHVALRRPQAREVKVAPGVDARAPVSIKHVGPERLVTRVIPKRPETVLVALTPRARLTAQTGQVITQPRQIGRPITVLGAVTRPRLLGRANEPRAPAHNAVAPSQPEMVVHEDAPHDGPLIPEDILARSRAALQTAEASKTDAQSF